MRPLAVLNRIYRSALVQCESDELAREISQRDRDRLIDRVICMRGTRQRSQADRLRQRFRACAQR